MGEPEVVEVKDVEELSPFDEMINKIGNVEYLIRVLFNSDFITAETTTKKDVIEKMNILKTQVNTSEQFTGADKDVLVKGILKLEVLLGAVEYLREKIEKSKEVVLEKGNDLGWSELEKEDWRVEFVQQASKCGRFQAIKALEDTNDLKAAIAEAPKLKASPPSFGEKPPADLMSTLQRAKKKF